MQHFHNAFALHGLPLHRSALVHLNFAKFKRKLGSEILVQVHCQKGSEKILNVRTVQPTMEVLAALQLLLVISICSEFHANNEKAKEVICYVPYKYMSGCRLLSH